MTTNVSSLVNKIHLLEKPEGTLSYLVPYKDCCDVVNGLEEDVLEAVKLLMRALAEQNLSVELDADIRSFIKALHQEHIGDELV